MSGEPTIDHPTEAEHVARVKADEGSRATVATEAETILATHGQRRINLIWERTQSAIAISVVEVTLAVAAILIVAPSFRTNPDQASVTASVTGLVLLSGLANLILGFYFSRTNHEKVGGVPAATAGLGEDPSETRR